jgi:surface protein
MFTDSVNLTANYSDTPNTSNVTSTAYMFDYSSFNGDVSGWDTGSVTNMSYMFSNTSNFNNGGEPLDWSDTSNVTTMESMFDYASSFNQDVSDWDTGSVTSMYYMFSSASAFNNGGEPLDWSDTSNVTEAGTMFDYAGSFNQDVSSWDVSSMQNMDYMFNSASAFNNGGEPLDWNAESALSARSFLSGTSFSEDNSGMCTPYVKSAVNYASGAPIENDDSKLPDFGAPCNPGTVSSTSDPFIITIDTTTNGSTANNEFRINTGYDTFNYDYDVSTDGTVTNAASELQNVNGDLVLEFDSSGVYQVEITGKLPHLKYDKTLDDARKIESIDQWGGMQWQSMDYMFYEGLNINANYSDQPNTSNVTSMYATFGEAYRFNGDLSGIDTSNVVDMRKTFLNSLDFNQNINSWDTGNVKLMNETFKNTNSFNQDLSNWDTSNVTSMRSMFNGASAFNQDISSWNTSNVTNMVRLFKDATSFNQDISPWCVSQISFEPYDFDAGAGFDGDTAKQPDWGNTC